MADDTLDTLIRFRLNVPELRADFQALRRELEFFNSFAVTAGKGVGQSLENARVTLGIRAFKDIREEIAGVVSAYDTLAKSAKLSGRELEASFVATQNRIKELRAELTRNIPVKEDPIAAARSVIGVRAAQTIQADIASIVKAFDVLKQSAKLSGQEIDSAFGTAQKRVDALKAELVKNIQVKQDPAVAARATLGVRSNKEIVGDIDAIREAYRNLRAAGTLTGQELETSFLAARKRLRELRDEARGAQFLNQRTGARSPQGPPPSQPNFLSSLGIEFFGRLTAASIVAELAVKAITAAFHGFFTVLSSGIIFLKETETRTLGIAGILVSLTDINGAAINLTQGLAGATQIVARLNDAALATAATSRDLTAAFQGIVGPGLAAGLTIEQIIQLSVTGVNAVRSLGLNSTQVVQELRDLIQGGIQPASSTVATSLQISDADIKRLRGNGQALFDFLTTKLAGFAASSAAFGQTFAGSFDQLKDIFTRLASVASLSVFENLRSIFNSMVRSLVTIDEITKQVTFNPDVLKAAKDLSDTFEAFFIGIQELGRGLGITGKELQGFLAIARLISVHFLSLADTVRSIGGTILSVSGLIANTVAGSSAIANNLLQEVGLASTGDSLDIAVKKQGALADLLFQTGTKLLQAKSSVEAFNESLANTAIVSTKGVIAIGDFTQKINNIIKQSSEIALPLRSAINKTADEAVKLLAVLEQLSGKKLNATQQTAVKDNLLITRQALNHSAKEFEDVAKPLQDVFVQNLKNFGDTLTSITTGNASVRNLASDFRRVNTELSGVLDTAARVSQIDSAHSLGALTDGFNQLSTALSNLDAATSNNKTNVSDSFSGAFQKLDEARLSTINSARARAIRDSPDDGRGFLADIRSANAQASEAKVQLQERQQKEFVEIDRKALGERRQLYEQLFQTTDALAKTALQKYQQYAQQVIQLDRQIASSRLDLQTSEADLNRQGKSNPEQLRSVRQEIKVLASQTQAALQNGDDQLVQSLVSRRRSLARELLSLGGEDERNNALKENRVAAEDAIGLLERQRNAAAEARNQQLATFQFLQQTLTDLQSKINEINFKGVTLQVQVDESSLQSVVDQIRAAVSNIVATVRVQALIEANGVQGFAGGGPIRGPGTSTSDSILIAASNREFMMNARAVDYWGESYMQDINNRRVPGFAGGGLIGGGGGGSGGARDSLDLNFNVGGSKFRVNGARDQVMGLADALSEISRGLH